MGIDLRWEDEHGEALECLLDERALVVAVLAAASPQTVCLRFIDPYGDTVFNQAQIMVLVEELSWLPEERLSPEERGHLRKLVELAERARGEIHTYLKFRGD